MKTLLLVGLLAGSIGLNIYLLNSPILVQGSLDDDLSEPLDEIKMAQSAIKKEPNTLRHISESHQSNLNQIKEKFLPKEDLPEVDASENLKDEKAGEYDLEYSKQKENWQHDMTSFLLDEIGLNQNGVDKYFEIVNAREKEISEYMQPKFEGLGPDEAYFFTIEDNIAHGRINEKYLKQLKKYLGPEGFENYNKFKQKYNTASLKDGETYFLMEF